MRWLDKAGTVSMKKSEISKVRREGKVYDAGEHDPVLAEKPFIDDLVMRNLTW